MKIAGVSGGSTLVGLIPDVRFSIPLPEIGAKSLCV
jgi:hypothetical protein